MHPLLKPGLRRLWREDSVLQLGSDPDRAVVLGGLDASTAQVVGLFDGTRDVGALQRLARGRGVEPTQVARLLALLTACGALDDAGADVGAMAGLTRLERDRLAPDLAALSLRRVERRSLREPRPGDGGQGVLARRARSAVEVRGAGRVGATLGVLLAAAGVGSVGVVDPAAVRAVDIAPGGLRPEDLGRSREDATVEAIHRIAPSATRGRAPTRTDIVILSPVGGLSAHHGAGLGATTHLAVSLRDGRGVVGPLVVPGRSSCLHCHDLHRRDRDPGWPRIAAQLSTDTGGVTPCEAPLAMALAALGAAQTLAHLDGDAEPATVDGTLEIDMPELRPRRRTWSPHPLCRCGAARPDGPDDDPRGMMTG